MSNIFIQNKMQYRSLFIALFSFSSMAAAMDANKVEVIITGKLVYPPPCKISSDVNVEFDDMLTTNVDIQRKDIPLTLNCAGAKKDQLAYRVTGRGMSGNAYQWFETDISGLGIGIYNQDDTELTISSWYSFDKDDVPTFYARTRHYSTTVIEPGNFSATITLEIKHE
ncbi:TPA: fimbrial protein [Enterobacter roggenkampii]